jgi:dTDP-glucose pyrophosphorylase
VRYLVPIASYDDLFPRAEFHFPKWLVEIDGEPLIARVVSHLRQDDPEAEFVFVVRGDECNEFSLDRSLEETTGGRCTVVRLSHSTMGAACSALMAIDHIDDDQPLVICNGDQIITGGVPAALVKFRSSGADAGVITFPSIHPRWSYVKRDDDGHIIEAAEKKVISREAIAGFYYFRTGESFVRAAKQAILDGRASNGVYYISPTLNQMILEGGSIDAYPIESMQYQSLFSPQRVESYERQIQAERITGAKPTPAQRPLTIVIPMAGLGSRFSAAGYDKPKPFIDVAGKPMIERVMDNLHVPGARYILVARSEHIAAEPDTVARLIARGDVTMAPIDLVTEGATCTVLTAQRLWDPLAPLLIANCDQIVDFDCAAFIADARSRELDGSILVFQDSDRDPKWSFARLDDEQLVVEVQEKKPISDLATVGLYYFGTAEGFTRAAIDMIAKNIRTSNEFYVCPVYNQSIAAGERIGVYHVEESAMHGIGTPQDLQAYMGLRGWQH